MSEPEDQNDDVTSARPPLDLDQLVAGITDENRHDETDWGRPAGAEMW